VRVLLDPFLLSAAVLVTTVKVLETLQSQYNVLQRHLAALLHSTTNRRRRTEL
jgi:hypothetical protein